MTDDIIQVGSPIPEAVTVEVRDPFTLLVTFSDGKVVETTFCPEELTGVFLPMKDPDYFKRAFVDPETKTVGWPNGVDIDPCTLYEPPLGKPGNREQTQQGGASIAAEG